MRAAGFSTIGLVAAVGATGGHDASAQSIPVAPGALLKYDIAVTLDAQPLRLGVTARIEIPPANEPRSRLSFALSELFPDPAVEIGDHARVEAVHAERTNRPYSRPGWGTNTWTLTPGRPIPAGQPVVLVVHYVRGGDLKSFGFSVGDRAAFAAGQTTAWYPEIEEEEPHPAGRLRGLRATGDLRFDVDSGVIVYGAGRVLSDTVQGTRRKVRYRADVPVYFSFAAGRYFRTGPTYYFKPRETARQNGARALEVLRVLEAELGRHPFGQFAVVEVPTGDGERAGFAGASADGFIMATSAFLDQPFNTAYYATRSHTSGGA